MAAFLAAPLNAQESIPPELAEARAKYKKTVEEAIAPIRANYLKYLERIKTDLAAAGRLEEARTVEREIGGMSDLKPKPIAAEESPAVSGKKFTIDAQQPKGTLIGSASEGQTLRLEYDDGKWKQGGAGFELLSPDEDGKQVVVVGVIAGKREQLWMVPRGSERRAFREEFIKDYDEIWLTIDDFNHDDNEGEVTYKVTID